MYSVNCFFPWFIEEYDYVDCISAALNISADQIVSVRTETHNNILVFSVASVEVFNRLQQFVPRVLSFSISDGRFTLECFAYPDSPQYRFIKISVRSADNSADNLIGLLKGPGTVLYKRYMTHEIPTTGDFRSDTIGMVVRMPAPCQQLPGSGQQVQTAATAVPRVQVAGPSSGGTACNHPAGSPAVAPQQPGCFPQQGAVQPSAVFLHLLQPKHVQLFGFIEASPNDGNFIRNGTPHGPINHRPTTSMSSTAQNTSENGGDESSSQYPSSEDQYPESSSD